MTNGMVNQDSSESAFHDSELELMRKLELMRNKYAVLIVDAFLTDANVQEDAPKKIDNIRGLVSCAACQNIPTIFTEFGDDEGCATNASLISAAKNPIRVVKNQVHAFETTGLPILLEKLGARELIVGGYHAEVCVYDAVKSAVERGFKVHTSLDILIGLSDSNKIVVPEVLDFYRNNTNFIENGGYRLLPIFKREGCIADGKEK